MTDDAGVAAGMRAMLARREAEIADGAVPIGWKVAINVPAAQEALGITEPVAGYMTSWTEIDPGATVDVAEWTAPMLEPEVAIRIGDDGTIASLSAAIELVDIDLPFEAIEPILARDVFHRGVVFGPEMDAASAEGLRCRVLVDGAEAAGTDVADDFAETVERVGGFLAAHEARLAPGDRIIAGSLTAPLPVAPGTAVEVELGTLGSVAVRFA